MIHIKKPKAPEWLVDPNGKWCEETKKAIAHYKSGATEAYDFQMYNDVNLKNELKKIFVKCAYCETSYGAVYDGDVEHFRPKGRVNEKKPQTPGYYWLANDWDNLLLACQHCNQRRQHILYGTTKLEGYGKLDQFPLQDEAKRAGDIPDIPKEEAARLLLNPCIDLPEDHLEYEPTEGVVRAKTAMGEASIKVYALQRPLLVQERKKMLILLFEQIWRVKEALVKSQNDNSETQKEIFLREFKNLINYGSATSLYSGMCRFFIRQFLKENDLGTI
ncbi:HNH endonuclease [Chryseolinea soli]|uniref:HNH endonuclease n=1 Tax=Chryseolinea soli TaxID=2321403 RepID=A0A385SUX0_9BACT|nr:HNH endonuclease [Chryseolinea soli]AYB33765.1 HNH endonuclease [Chryseolinea soli]